MGAIDKLPSGRWRARWREYPNAPQRSRTFDRKLDADRHLLEVEHALASGTYVTGEAPWATWAADYAARQPWRPPTRPASPRCSTPRARGGRSGLWSRSDAATSRPSSSASGSARAPRGHARSVLSSAFRAAVDDGLLARNPVAGVKVAATARTLTVPTTLDVLDVLERAGDVLAPAVVLAGFAGLRHAEATGLTVDRIDFLRRTIRVDRQWVTPTSGPASFGAPKTPASTRTVPVAAEVVELLARSVEVQGTGGDGRLVHAEGHPLNRRAFGRRWTKLHAGFRYHDLRHHFASLLIAAGCSVPAVQHALGHDNATTTLNTYSHLWPSDVDRLRNAVAAGLAGRLEAAERGEGRSW